MPCCRGNQKQPVMLGASFPLAFASEGEKVRIVLIRGGGLMRERLLSIGICLEDEIEIVKKHDGGAILVAREGNRVALGGGMGQKINVIKC